MNPICRIYDSCRNFIFRHLNRPGCFSALRDGIRRVTRAPAIVIGVWALTLLVSLPLTVVTGHNAGAALLLLSVVNLIHRLTPPTGQR